MKSKLIISCRMMHYLIKRVMIKRVFFIYQWLDDVKIHKYTQLEQNIPCGTRVRNIFTTRAQSARMMLDEASSPFCIPVAGQC